MNHKNCPNFSITVVVVADVVGFLDYAVPYCSHMHWLRPPAIDAAK